MSRPLFSVDFNEMVDADTVLLSAGDTKTDASGVIVRLYEGMLVSVYMDDVDENGTYDKLMANGSVVKNIPEGWSAHVKWCCKIDEHGVRAQSQISSLGPV